MHVPLRSFLTAAALVAIGAFATAVGGCASKPPQPQSASPAAPPAPSAQSKPTSSGTGTSAKDETPASGGASAGAQTSDERRAALDKRLSDSLGAFDAQLRAEQQRNARERDARQATVTTVAATDGSTKPDPEESAAAAENAAADPPHKSNRGTTNSRSARSGDLKSDKSASGGGTASGNGAVSAEIPDGNDDDVIARRLRKAAEQETDPELKDKLWKEYVEYKKNTQGK